MTDFVKLGAVLTLIGFLAVGSGFLFVGLAPSPSTLGEIQAAAQSAKNWEVIQGLGWIVAGSGLCLALFGSAKSDTAIDTKSEILLERLPLRQSKFVCEKCGGDVSKELENEIELHRPILVVIDNLLAFLGHGVIDTNRASLMSQYMMRFRKLVREYDVAFLLVHHGKKPTKDVSEEGPENALGSTALSALCDTRMQIHSPDHEPILETWSKVFRNQRIPMAFDRERFLWTERHHDGD